MMQALLNGSCLVSAERMRKAMALALLGNQHCLVVGPKGVGKTEFHTELFNAIDLPNEDKAVISGYKGAGEEILLNYLNPAKLEDGEFEYLPGPSILNRKLVYLDEVEKLARLTQQILLQVMQSRRFSRAGIDKRVPLDTLFAGGNGEPEDPAVRDRFGIQIPLERNEQLIKDVCVWSIGEGSTSRQPHGQIHWNLVKLARLEVAELPVHNHATSLMIELALEFELSPRRVAQVMVPVSRAQAYINGRSQVTPEDVMEAAPFLVLHEGPLTEERFQHLEERFGEIRRKAERVAAIQEMQTSLQRSREAVGEALEAAQQSLSRNTLKALQQAVAAMRQRVAQMPNPDTCDKATAELVSKELVLCNRAYNEVLDQLGLRM